MTRLVAFSAVVFSLLAPSPTRSAKPQQPFNLGQNTVPAIPSDVLMTMNRQEQRLDQIDTRLTVIEKTVTRMDEDVRELVKTNNVLVFLIDMAKFFIPGIFITAFGIWFKKYLDKSPNLPVAP